MAWEMEKFEPHRLLKNRHAMTIAAAFARRLFTCASSGSQLKCAKILGRCHWQSGKRRDVPVIAILHGLEGSSESNYARGIAEKAYRLGFHAVRLNQRNCGGTETLTPTLYNSGMSGDYRAVLEELSNKDGFGADFLRRLFDGRNLVTKMAGEFGDAVPKALRGVCVVCPAMDLGACADALQLRQNFFYQRHFVKGLMSRYAKKAKLFPKRYRLEGLGAVRSVREFDDKITAPQFGYRDAQDYYDAVGAKKVVAQVRVPMLMITAQDDPFVPYELFQRAKPAQNPAIRFVTPEHGGHCGFISNRSGAERFWAEQRIVEFCCAIRGA